MGARSASIFYAIKEGVTGYTNKMNIDVYIYYYYLKEAAEIYEDNKE
jgi:hypothetical protein